MKKKCTSKTLPIVVALGDNSSMFFSLVNDHHINPILRPSLRDILLYFSFSRTITSTSTSTWRESLHEITIIRLRGKYERIYVQRMEKSGFDAVRGQFPDSQSNLT